MLIDATSHLFVYLTLYSTTVVAGLLFTWWPRAPKGPRLVGLGLLILSLGFPPSPLFFVKLTLGAVCASAFGAVFCALLGVLLLVVWFRFLSFALIRPNTRAGGHVAARRGLSPSCLSPMFCVAGLALLACTPLGLGLVCSL